MKFYVTHWSATRFRVGCPFPGCYKFGFRSSVQKNSPRGREDTRVWYRETMFSCKLFRTIFPCTDPCMNTFWTSSPPPPPQPPQETQKALRTWSDSIIRVTLSVLSLFEFKSVDDVSAGKLREMLTLHTNSHAVHGRFTLKDDCERQVRNAGAVSWTQRENYRSM